MYIHIHLYVLYICALCSTHIQSLYFIAISSPYCCENNIQLRVACVCYITTYKPNVYVLFIYRIHCLSMNISMNTLPFVIAGCGLYPHLSRWWRYNLHPTDSIPYSASYKIIISTTYIFVMLSVPGISPCPYAYLFLLRVFYYNSNI